MALFFTSRPGYVTAIPIPQDVPMPLAISGWGAEAFKAIITDISGNRREGLQSSASLREQVYVYAFPEQMGRFRVAGLAFVADCGNDPKTGLEYVLEYYDAFRSSQQAEPLTIAVGTSPSGRFDGFLTGVDFGISQPDSRIGQFALEIQILPRLGGGGGEA